MGLCSKDAPERLPVRPLSADDVHRKCTDVGARAGASRQLLCLFLFVLMIGGMSAVSLYAWQHGDYRRVLGGVDVNGCEWILSRSTSQASVASRTQL